MADGTTKPIEEIRPGDEVASFDPNALHGLGPLKPGKVTRTSTNITKTIINLRGTHMASGHVVLMDNGEWDIIARDPGSDEGQTFADQELAPLIREVVRGLNHQP